jgi:phosphomannomutase
MTHRFHPSILRAYDIRGIYNQTLFNRDAYILGRSFASVLIENGGKKISVASDGRLSSPELKSDLIKGLLDSGLEVIDIGVGPTPMLYFSVYHLYCDAGIMVTGSHNPKDHNGFKMMMKDRPFFGEEILKLSEIAKAEKFINGHGKLKHHHIEEEYIDKILEDCLVGESKSHLLDEIDEFHPVKKLKIAWDCGNGATGKIIKKITSRIFADNILLFEEIDGNFPNHHPDPTEPNNLRHLKNTVLSESCDIGIAFDGDGDRIGVIDNTGEILWGDQLLVFYARQILETRKGATIIADVKASNTLFEEIKKAGGNPIMWKTGHSLIKSKMKETKAVLAGEMSGHIFFADKYYGFDDAIYAAIRLIDIVFEANFSLAYLKKSLPKTHSTPEIRIECTEEQKFIIVEKLKTHLQQKHIEFCDIDGVRVTNNKGWWLIRASNTQPVLVARCEANSVENLKEIKSDLRANLEFFQINIPNQLL